MLVQPQVHSVSGLLSDRDGAVVGAELVVAGSSRPSANVVRAGVKSDTFTLGRGVQALAEVLGRDDVEERLGRERGLLDTVAL